MKLSTDQKEGVTIIRFEEESSLDAGNSMEFRAEIATSLAQNDKVIIDLGNAIFIDSSGIGALVAISREFSKKGGELRLMALTPAVQTVFEITRLYRFFEIYDTEEEALASF
jgi:anti-sigma B factor antagonist